MISKMLHPCHMSELVVRTAAICLGFYWLQGRFPWYGSARHGHAVHSTAVGRVDPEEGVPGEEGRRQHVDHRRLHRHGPGLGQISKYLTSRYFTQRGASAPCDTMLRLGREHNTKSGGGLRQAPF